MKKVVIGAGSCIIQAILGQFQTIPGLADKAELHLSQILPGGREKLAPDLLARCAILIEEAAPWQKSGTLTSEERAHLPESCVTITVPTLHFNSLWPLMTEDPRNVPEPGAPYGRIPFGMGDKLALKIVQTEPDPEKRRAAYDAAGLRGLVNPARSHELEIRNCFAREQGCDVRVAAYVMAHFREKRLYYTHNHPTGELMYVVLSQLYALAPLRELIKLPYDQLITAARLWADTSNVFGGEEAPVHPEVAAYFGLQWWTPDHRYAWMNEARSFDEWIDWYLRYDPRPATPEPPPPAPEPGPRLACGLFMDTMYDQGSLPGAVELEPAALIARPAPFAAIGLDPALARHGAVLTDPAARRYRASRTLLAPLRGAAILGSTGLILQDGAILGDSFRNLVADAVIAAVGADAVVLQPGLLPARHIEGRAFCGFAPGWDDQAHWLIGGLPRLIAFMRLRLRDPALRLVLPPLTAGSLPAQCVALLGIPEEQVIQIGAAEALSFDELFVLSALDLWSVSPFSRHAAHELASTLALTAPPGHTAARIHLRSAAVASRMDNADAVAAALASLGFAIIDFDALDLAQRVAVMRRAEVVVGEHGPSLANLFFCAPGTRVLELFGPSAPQPMYWSVAAACGLQYGYAVGTPVPTETPGRRETYTLSPDSLAAALSAMLALG
jgi:hypothetical protein